MTAEPSRHKCLIYDGHPSEQLPVIVPFLIQCLDEGRRCLYLGDQDTVHMVDSALAAKGVDTDEKKKRQALVFSSDRGHLEGGIFDPSAMVAMLRQMVEQAIHDGFHGLCATGDMMWELGTEKNLERLLEYEALLEQAFRDLPLTGICQYRKEAIPSRVISDALMCHRSAYVGAALNRDNFFYIPPELLLKAPDASVRDKRGEWMCQQITRVLRAEEKRDKALAALIESESVQRRLAEELSKANADLEHRVNERTAELRAANKELEAFSYSVSHDLNAPLRHILGFSKVLEDEAGQSLSKAAREYLVKICDSAKRMSSLIGGLLALSRTTSIELHKAQTPLGPVVDEVLQELEPEIKSRNILWEIGELPEVECDRSLLFQVFVNLIGNAVKYTSKREKAVIEIGSKLRPGEVVLFVRDNGVGFDPHDSPRLFKIFERLHPKMEFEGNGIGLTNVERIIRRHGGKVWAEGEPGKGAVFYFSLPSKRDPSR